MKILRADVQYEQNSVKTFDNVRSSSAKRQIAFSA